MYYEDLNMEEQARVERALVKLITSGTIKENCHAGSHFTYIQCSKSYHWIGNDSKFGAVCCIGLKLRPNEPIIRFPNQLPRAVELLLAITYRKFFEAYKAWKEQQNAHAETL